MSHGWDENAYKILLEKRDRVGYLVVDRCGMDSAGSGKGTMASSQSLPFGFNKRQRIHLLGEPLSASQMALSHGARYINTAVFEGDKL
jgi:hypothetical protein